ncbi:MAG TPA: protein phosphatase 2C domain-containing protein [Gammaproteobacteria bacterium]|nr:protein phosphatase 2C domain-containing protein [Gammaproteobacteria bacterium]
MANPQAVASTQILGARELQEDALGIFVPVSATGPRDGEVLLVLADGMGGHTGGEVASRLVVDSFSSAYRECDGDPANALRTSLGLANASLAGVIEHEPELAGMGCTLLGCAIAAGRLHWISVGDSPLWLFRDASLQRLNADHSMRPLLDDLVRTGVMSREAAHVDGRRNLLYSAVSGGTIAMIDLCEEPLPLRAGDLVMLASDGIETLDEAELVALLQDAGALAVDELAGTLLTAVEAAAASHQDNASLILYRC